MAFTAQDVKKLREMTEAGMMDCKRALVETDGDMDAAVKYLREQGILKGSKKAGRVATEGIVDSYIHLYGKIGVLVEVNCESDFVAKSDKFKELVHNIAMHIAAASPLYVSSDEVPAGIIESEKEIARAQELNAEKPKPEAVIEKIVDGKVKKYFKDNCLLEQLYVRDTSKTIQQLVTEATATIGEKISIRRFTRYAMGEGLEKKQDTFVDEIAETLNKMSK